MASKPLVDAGAGLTSKSSGLDPHPAGPVQHGAPGQMERAFTAASTFFSGMLAINASQFLGAPLKAIDPKFYDAYMAFTKQSFGVLITTMTQWWSPTTVRVSGDSSIPKQLFRKPDGSLQCRFPKRLVMMANHQLYTDWLYLWWIAYTNNMHGYIYIILKESLKNVPIVGWGAQFYNFIFLSRNWERDQQQFKSHLDRLNNAADPMWLLIFPEGTNLAKGTRERSKAWADKNGLQDMKHQLLPRSRGLQFSLQNLRKTTEWLYDCTIGYEGIPPGKFGQDIFTLRSSMFEGRPPKSVNMHFRRFKISDIPLDSDKAFEVWIRNRWREKDYLLEHFVRFNRFPEDDKWMVKQRNAGRNQLIPQPARSIETQIKSNSLEEFLSIFAPLSSIMMVLFVIYGGSNPSDLMQMLGGVGKLGKNKIDLVRDDQSKEQPLKLQKQISTPGDGANLASFMDISRLTPAAAQKELIHKYLNSVRPAATSQISLPEQALRKSNIPVRKVKADSVKSQPARAVSRMPARKAPKVAGAPSIVSAPAIGLKPSTNLNSTAKAPTSNAAKTKPAPKAKAPVPNAKQVQATPTAGKTQQTTPAKPIRPGTQKPSTQSQGRGVTIDPKMLAKMKGVDKKPNFAGKGVTVDPKVLSRMKGNAKPGG